MTPAKVAVSAAFNHPGLVPLLLAKSNTRAATAAGWRREVFVEYYYNAPNVHCVGNCSADPVARAYPQRDAECTDLDSEPNGVCWSGDMPGQMCTKACYPTEDTTNNFLGLRRVTDGTLYAEYQKGDQAQANVDFAAPTFYELFDATSDPWHMHNLHVTADPHISAALHADLHVWYGCAGVTCP